MVRDAGRKVVSVCQDAGDTQLVTGAPVRQLCCWAHEGGNQTGTSAKPARGDELVTGTTAVMGAAALICTAVSGSTLGDDDILETLQLDGAIESQHKALPPWVIAFNLSRRLCSRSKQLVQATSSSSNSNSYKQLQDCDTQSNHSFKSESDADKVKPNTFPQPNL